MQVRKTLCLFDIRDDIYGHPAVELIPCSQSFVENVMVLSVAVKLSSEVVFSDFELLSILLATGAQKTNQVLVPFERRANL